MKQTRYLIFTDLDGTLLDHDNYSFEPALSTLRKLDEKGHFVMPCTSKTAAEVAVLREEIPLTTPFIIENGAAVLIPDSFFPFAPPETSELAGFYRKDFCQAREHWLDLLQTKASDFAHLYQGFSQMSQAEIVEYTGLTPENAQLASQRQFGEPLRWLGSEQEKQEFVAMMTALDANMLEGGRFLHVGGKTDKGTALLWTVNTFDRECDDYEFISIALGDSGNDIAMLEAADIAVQIKSPHHGFPTINKKQNLYLSTQYGPAGWAEILEQLIFSA